MLTAWLIRHGESVANTGQVTDDPATIELTPRGHAQAQQIVPLFTTPPTLIVTSSFIRTRQTAMPTIKRFPNTATAEWPVQEFTYLSPPRYRNTSTAQRRPAAQEYWKRGDPYSIDGEGAESFSTFISRVQQLKARVTAQNSGLVAVFTHETFIQAVLWTILNNITTLDGAQMIKFRVFSGSFSIPHGARVRLDFRGREIWMSGIDSTHISV